MPEDLFIKNTPNDVAERLRKQAAAHDRSLEEELLAIVEAAVPPDAPWSIDQVFAEARRLRTGPSESSIDLIRAD